MNQAVVAAPSLTSDCFKWCFVLGGKRSWGLCSACLPVLICLIPAFSPESCNKVPQPAAMGASQLRESGCTFLSDWFITQLFSLINFLLNAHTPETKKMIQNLQPWISASIWCSKIWEFGYREQKLSKQGMGAWIWWSLQGVKGLGWLRQGLWWPHAAPRAAPNAPSSIKIGKHR